MKRFSPILFNCNNGIQPKMKISFRVAVFISVFCMTFTSEGQSPDLVESDEQPVTVFDKPVDFTGWKGEVLSPQSLAEIRIGLFLPYDPSEPVAGPILKAVDMAIAEFNSAGGFYGIPFRLKTRWSYNPWGAGSKEMIKLVYEDSVWAVIGSMDGAATHIAQQIVTKARVPLLSPISADPTLTYIRVPWIFRLPPDFEIQAKIIAQQGIEKASLKNVGLLTSTDHDGRTFADEMRIQLNNIQVTPIFHLEVSDIKPDIFELNRYLITYDMDGIIMYLPPAILKALLRDLQTENRKVTVVIPWIPGLLIDELLKEFRGKIFYIQPFSQSGNLAYAAFAENFFQQYGVNPPPEAAYTYDAIKMLICSLFKSGLNRSKLRDELSRIGTFQGVTGKIFWDNAGGNQTEPILNYLPGSQNK
jgi:branched-chain amino acid transport system substrate-binding protein